MKDFYECKKCGEYIERGILCEICSKNSLESHINRQLTEGSTKIIIHISDLLAKLTSDIIISKLNDNPQITYLELKARGRHIQRAVDVLEILKRELKLKKSLIKTNTEEFVSKEGQEVKVSQINITLKK